MVIFSWGSLNLDPVNRWGALWFKWRQGFKRILLQSAAAAAAGKAILRRHWHYAG